MYKFSLSDRIEFRWKKTKNGICYQSNAGFGTLEDAVASMEEHFSSADTQEEIANAKVGVDRSKWARTVRVFPRKYSPPSLP